MPNIDASTVFRALRVMWREWWPDLLPTEREVLSFIFDRTLLWNKSCETIPMSHFIDGVPKCRGGTGLKRSAIYQALASLKAKGLIIVSNVTKTKAPRYAISLKPRAESDRSDTRVSAAADEGVHDGGQQVSIPADTKYTEEENMQKIRGGQQVPASLLGSLSSKREQSNQCRERRKQKEGMDAYRCAWIDAARTAFPEATIAELSGRELLMLRSAIKRLPADTDKRRFLETIATNWHSVFATTLSWMKSRPLTPDVGFMARFFPQFVEFYNRREVGAVNIMPRPQKKDRELSDSEYAELQRLRAEVARADAPQSAPTPRPVATGVTRLRRPTTFATRLPSASTISASAAALGLRKWGT